MVECELAKTDFQQRLGPRGVLIISWGLMIGMPSARYRVGLHMEFKAAEEQHLAEEQCLPALCI
jgi:hypothetical protein